MKILSVHNRYVFGGGEDGVREAECALLRAHEHTVEEYSEDNRTIRDMNKISVARRTIWSRETYHAVRQLLHNQSFDVIHVHNYCPLISPAVYYAAHKEGVATIQSLHNYRQVCPSGILLRKGRICEDCLHKRLKWPAIAHACYRNSRVASAAVSTMLFAHRAVGTWSQRVDAYIATNDFSRDCYVAGGLPAEKVHVKPNFVEPDLGVGTHDGGFALFAGRLSPEKGIRQLLRVWEKLKPGYPLKIAGDGPLRGEVEERVATQPNVDYVGLATREEMLHWMQAASFLVFPSTWYECMPLTILEAFSAGMPVIGPKLGPMSIIIEACRTGLLFEPGDEVELLRCLQEAVDSPDQIRRMGEESRKEYVAKYTADHNYRMLMHIYEQALTLRKQASDSTT